MVPMINPGINPVYLPVSMEQSAALRVGQRLNAVVQELRGQWTLQMGANRIAIPPQRGIMSGSPVLVEVVSKQGALMLKIQPLHAGGTAALHARPEGPPTLFSPSGPVLSPQTVSPEITARLGRILEPLGLLKQLPEILQIIPAQMRQQTEAMRQMMLVLFSPVSLADDLQQLLGWLEQAASAGAIPAQMAETFQQWAAPWISLQSADVAVFMKRLRLEMGLEARLAHAIESDRFDEALDALQQSVRLLVGRLREDEALHTFLGKQGDEQRFSALIERVLERFHGAAMQNARGGEAPYWFFDVPFAASMGFRRVQAHVFGESPASKRHSGRGQVFVALDLSCTRLGDLWVTLQIREHQCQCHFRAASPGTVAALERATGELAECLAGIGLPGAQVTVAPWDGNRLHELAAIMRRFGGIDMQV